MPNAYFQFKQFTIHQAHCAMKVTTEACILGAWVNDNKAKYILDIGTGTGLLALMLAQRMNGQIDAVELDPQAAAQANKNVKDSLWSERINIIQGDIFDFAKKSNQSYDLIISNPPFFSNSQKSSSSDKNQAKHDTEAFDKSRLAMALKHLLSDNGKAYILYPEHESQQFQEAIAKIGLKSEIVLVIHNQPEGPVFRTVTMVSKAEIQVEKETLNIRAGHSHPEKFQTLLRPYYLKL